MKLEHLIWSAPPGGRCSESRAHFTVRSRDLALGRGLAVALPRIASDGVPRVDVYVRDMPHKERLGGALSSSRAP